MDQTQRDQFLAAPRTDEEFRAAVRRELLTEELLGLPDTAATLVDVIAQQRLDFTALTASVGTYMERTITLIGEGFNALRDDVGGLRTDMEHGFAAVEANFAAVEASFVAVNAKFDAKFDQIDANIREIKDQLAP